MCTRSSKRVTRLSRLQCYRRRPVAEPADRVVLKTGSDLHFIKTADIIWVESQADFIKVHTTGTAQLVRETLQSLEDRVDPAKFLRIHRSSLVNVDHVRKVTPALYGDYTVLMSDNTVLRLSRKNRARLKLLISAAFDAGGRIKSGLAGAARADAAPTRREVVQNRPEIGRCISSRIYSCWWYRRSAQSICCC